MDANRALRNIKSLKVQGAENVAKAGISILRDFASAYKKGDKEFVRDFLALARKVSAARPTEPALRREVYFVTEKVKSSRSPKKDAILLSDFYIRELGAVKEKIALFGSRKIQDGDVIMTHCHSNTVMAIFRKARASGKKFRVIVTETRPLLQGKKTADDLSKMRVPFIYVIDSAEAHFMKQATNVLVGADAILADGSIVNKIGTESLAIIAKEFNVPFLCAAGTHKFDEKTIFGFEELIEERCHKELWDNKKIRIKNPAFDITAGKYIAGIITERGVFSPDALVAMLSGEAVNDAN